MFCVIMIAVDAKNTNLFLNKCQFRNIFYAIFYFFLICLEIVKVFEDMSL
jgi:hypothetical protein